MARKPKTAKGKQYPIVLMTFLAMLLGCAVFWHYNVNADPKLTFPSPRLPSPNAYDFYLRAVKLNEALRQATPGADAVDADTDPHPVSGLSPQQLAQRYPTAAKEAWIKKNAPVLALIRQGFKYQYRHPPRRTFIGKQDPDFQFSFGDLGELLLAESHARVERGDWTGASRSALDDLHLGHDLLSGSPNFSAYIAFGLTIRGCIQLQKILPHLGTAASRAAARQIEKLESSRITYAEMLQQAKWDGQADLQERMREADPDWCLSQLYLPQRKLPDPVDSSLKTRLRSYSKRYAMDDYTHYVDALIIEAKKPYLSRRQVLVLPEGSDLSRLSYDSARNEASTALLEVELALRAFKSEHGMFPTTLNALVPGYLKKVPRDPFGGGEPLHYWTNGKSYILYSIGPDGVDDKGTPVDDPANNRPWRTPNSRYGVRPASKGDFVAGVSY